MNAYPTRRSFLRLSTPAFLALSSHRASGGGRPNDANRYLKIVQNYARAMLDHGIGKNSPLFAEALDRHTLTPLNDDFLRKTEKLKFDEWGIRPQDRMLGGANPMHSENLYQVLYALSEITGDQTYSVAADESLRFFFGHCQSPATGLFYWGEHAGWDLRKDAPLTGAASTNTHEFYRPWALWQRSWALAPEPCRKFALGLWEHQIGDHKTGLYSRHATIDHHGPGTEAPYPRHGGFYVETWAWAYKQTQDAVFLNAIETVVDGLENMRRNGGMLPGGSLKSTKTRIERDGSLAVSLWEASTLVPEPLSRKLREVARANDVPTSSTLAPKLTSNLWSDGYGGSGGEIASRANLLGLRHLQCKPELYRDRILAHAQVYVSAPANLSFPVYPGTFGKVIYLLLHAYELTSEERFLSRAGDLARQAEDLFLPGGSPLPKATHLHDHYEAVTNADTLMMSLLLLWGASQQPRRSLSLVYTDR